MSVKDNKYRINEQIRISPIRLIDANGQQVGVVETFQAMESARDAGLDLVEVAPDARPPVCRILDFGKFKYAQKKKAHESVKKQHRVQLKEVRLRPKIEEHDFDTKMEQARAFLKSGHRVQVNLVFRGREMTHIDLAKQKLDRFIGLLDDLAKVEQMPRMEGRRMVLVLGVKPHVLQAIEKGREQTAQTPVAKAGGSIAAAATSPAAEEPATPHSLEETAGVTSQEEEGQTCPR